MACENTLNPRKGNDILIKVSNDFNAKAVTFSTPDDKVNFVAHGLINGDAVAFSAVTTTTTVVIDTVYYVVDKAADTFELSSTDPNSSAGTTLVTIDADGSGVSIKVFREVASLTSASIGLSSEEVDITNKNSNQWKELLNGAGVKSASISGSGFSSNDFSQGLIDSLFLSGEIREYRLYREGAIGASLDVSGDDYFQMCAKITSLTYAGEANQAQTIEISLSSSGTVTQNQVA